MATSNVRGFPGSSRTSPPSFNDLPAPLPIRGSPMASAHSLLAVDTRSSSRGNTPVSVSPATPPISSVLPHKKSFERRRHSSNSGGVRPKLSQLSGPSLTMSARRALSPVTSGPKPLNTHSPVALAAAAAVTPEKIAGLLTKEGPLAIRHITAYLADTISGFGELSLSKQRRLIIAVLDNGASASSPSNGGLTFDKVGWGRWAVHGQSTTIKHEDNDSEETSDDKPASLGDSKIASSPPVPALRAQGNASGPPVPRTLRHLLSDTDRRESISNQLPSHRLPLSPRLAPVGSAIEEDDVELEGDDLYKQSGDNAIYSSSDDDESVDTDEEDWQGIGAARLRASSPREQEAVAALVQLQSI